MKKVLIFLALLFCGVAHAGLMANVEYIHLLIKQQWCIELPYSPQLENPQVAANMKYLLTAVDATNKLLNGEPTTDYSNSKYATGIAVDTIASVDAVKRLIKAQKKFIVITTPNTSSFSFKMSAKGTFTVDWGDGNIQEIERTDTTTATYSHTYETAGRYKIAIDGRATEYSTSSSAAAISFGGNTHIARISGSLGAIFPTIDNGTKNGQQPRFYGTFSLCTNLKGTIPENLFAGIQGAPVSSMFSTTFVNCSGLSGSIPPNLFAGLSGAPATYMFNYTFSGCDNLSGPIPEKLFGRLAGAPADRMFNGTFNNCTGLTGHIPATLFSGINGTPKTEMFRDTFSGCTGLSGPSAQINNIPLYEIWPTATVGQVGGCYSGVTNLSDYADIPAVWK